MKNLENKVFLLTGTPGVGKTSVSEKLSKNYFVVHLNEEIKKHKLFLSEEDDTKVADEKKVINHLNELCREKKRDILIEGHFSHIYEDADKVVVLRCNPKKLKKRLSKRNYSRKKIKENIESEILDVCLSEAIEIHEIDKVNEIDTTERSIDQITNIAKLIFENKISKKPGSINYLQKNFNDII